MCTEEKITALNVCKRNKIQLTQGRFLKQLLCEIDLYLK